MKTKCKRLLSLLLVFVLVLGLMPSVYAATDEGTQPTTEPAVTEAATETVGDTEPTVPETTGAAEATDPSESTEGTQATEAPTEAEEEETEPSEDSDEDWTQPPEDDGMTPEEWDLLRWAELEAQLPDPIEEYFPFAPEIKYPYGEPQDNFYPSSLLEGDNRPMMFAANPYAVAPLADMDAIPDEMYDNSILRALEYTGYDVQWLKDNGYLYVAEYVSSNINNYRPEVLSNIGYDDYSPFLNGDETVSNSGTPTGKAPDIAKFEANGLVCASFVSYYINNYLPNIEGVDTSHIHEAIKATTVLPHDTTYLGIEEGMDICTLVTCTPFGVNTHRLLVRGFRIPYEEAEVIVEEQLQVEEPPKSTWEEQYIKGILLGIGVVILIACLYFYFQYRRKHRPKRVSHAEKQVRRSLKRKRGKYEAD